MNGYKVLADSYRKLLAEERIEKEVAEKEIRVLDFLATCDINDLCIMFNSSAFNDIFKGYLDAIVKDAELDPEQAARVKESARWILDTKTASEVLK